MTAGEPRPVQIGHLVLARTRGGQVVAQPSGLGRSRRAVDLAVEAVQPPTPDVERVVLTTVRTGQLCGEVRVVVRRRAGRHVVVVVAGRRTGLRLEPGPRLVVLRVVGGRPVLVRLIPGDQGVGRVDPLHQRTGLEVAPQGTGDVAGDRHDRSPGGRTGRGRAGPVVASVGGEETAAPTASTQICTRRSLSRSRSTTSATFRKGNG